MRANRGRIRRGEALPVNRNTEDVHEVETVLAGLPARRRLQLLMERTGLKRLVKGQTFAQSTFANQGNLPNYAPVFEDNDFASLADILL
jgi:hypothetical protein